MSPTEKNTMTDLDNRVIYLRRHRAHDPEYDMPARAVWREPMSFGAALGGIIAALLALLLVGLSVAGVV